MPERTFEQLIEELAQTRGLDFRGYKRNSQERRLRKRMTDLNLASVDEYKSYFHENPSEINDLLQTVLINVTSFFRDAAAWEALRKEAFPLMLDPLLPGDSFRAWCAGCATGEEVYSLAILLSEYLGPKLKSLDIKLYATDPDEEALTVARRGEYPADRLRSVRPELREKYFQGGSVVRVNREIRRLAIFGRSNLVSDAPISHVNLLICRNVLIYFDLALQKQVMARFRYALEDGGILFLGKAESQLRESSHFRFVNAKWRIFQCAPKERPLGRVARDNMDKADSEFESLQTVQRSIIGTLRQAILVLDPNDVVTTANDAAMNLWHVGEPFAGKRIFDTVLVERSRELGEYLQRSHITGNENLEFNLRINVNADERSLLVTIRAVRDAQGARAGTLIYAEDVSHQEKLRSTVQELETTNEELQSTNEELETTNEELQSTNEELETTNEELHSLNEELETTNEELEMRTRELDEINRRYAETLGHMPSPIMVVSDQQKIVLWNSSAQRLFGLDAKGVIGLTVQQLPLAYAFRNMLARKLNAVFQKQDSINVKTKAFRTPFFKGSMDVHFTPMNSPSLRAVLVIVNPQSTNSGEAKGQSARRKSGSRAKPKTAGKKKSSAKKSSRGNRRK